jgi:hypothetical protein
VPIPNFFIVGAAKAGTTALHHYLRQQGSRRVERLVNGRNPLRLAAKARTCRPRRGHCFVISTAAT